MLLINFEKIMTPVSTKLWLVEDQKDIREGMYSLLSFSGQFSGLKTFSNAEDMLEGLKEEAPQIVILDIGLPGINGVEALVRLKNKKPNVKVLIFTVFENDSHVFEALKAGADGYILKKERPEKILESIHDVLSGGAPMSREIARKVLETFHPQSADAAFEVLTTREKETLELLAKGFLYKEIADKLNISLSTVKLHLHHIYEKLHVQNRSEAILRYLGK